MKRIKRGNRILAVALSVVMAFGSLPTAAFAEGQRAQAANGLCEHHREHTAECGYVEGQSCEHRVNDGGDDRESPWLEVHSEACYRDELICGYDAEVETIATGSDAEHTHTQECHKMDCPHERGEHDDTCGYVETQPCGFNCELCREPAGPEPKPGDGIEQTACTLTEGCTLPAGHEGGCETELPPADGALVNTITSWKFIGDENLNEGELPMPGVNIERQADFDMVVSMLPTGISAEIEGETEPVQVDITGWSCPEYMRDENDNWPVTGEYVFTAELPEGYVCDPLPSVKALIGGAEFYADTTVGDFIITGDVSKYCTWDADRMLLTIKSGATLTIKNQNPKTSTVHMIKVEETAKDVNITLDGVNINRRLSLDPAFDMANATVTLILAEGSENILIGSQDHRAGLEVPANAKLIIEGSGTLIAEGGNGAGIGGFGTVYNDMNDAGDSGVITIRGSVQVKAKSVGGAGIGGGGKNGGQGNGGTGGQITIEEQANVDAVSQEGAGIGGGKGDGGGSGGEGRVVTIKDEAVVSASSDRGAGIGGGAAGMESAGTGGNGGTVIIQDKAQVTATSKMWNTGAGAGIGGGKGGNSGPNGNGGTVKISGEGVKVTASGSPDVGGNQGGSLSVDKATLEMQNNGTNAETIYKNCTVIEEGSSTEYNGEGNPIASPALSLSVSPLSSQTHPGDVILTATLSGASDGDAGKRIQFTGSGTHNVDTDDSGIATYTFEKLPPGTYDFGASFAGDPVNKPVTAESITGYTVSIGEQEELSIEGLDNAYTYGDDTFVIRTFGGSGAGAVSYQSSDESVASVTGDRVTILKAGTFTITATKEGDSNYSKKLFTSGTVTVNPATPEVSLTAMGGTDIYDPIELTATVSAVKTGATPTGTVTFKEGDISLAENVSLDDGKATCKVSSLAVGNHTYTAVYSGQSGFYNGANADHIVDVGFADQTDFAITDPGAKTYGDGDFVLETTGGQSVGDVEFSVPADNGVLTVTADGKVKITGAGKVTVEATKAGDSIYKPATATLDITVAPRDISNVTVSVTGSRVYTGGQLRPAFDLNDGNIAIAASDYTDSYGSNVDAGTDAGSITLTGQGNYTGTKEVKFNIEKCPLDSAVITLEAVSYTHTGTEIKPAVTDVVVDGIAVPASAFDVGYANNIAVGTATVTVTAKADGNYSGAKEEKFNIEKRSLDGAVITLEAVSHTHTGSEIKPAVTNVVVDGITVPDSEFDVQYANNIAVGTATVTVTAKADGNYSGAKEEKFNIEKRSLDDAAITLEAESYTYTGGEIKPAVTNVVVDGITVPDSEFDVQYADNIAVGTATVIVTAKTDGNYSDTKEVNFNIEKRSLDGAAITLEAESYTYTGGEIKPAVTNVVVDGITVPASAFDVGYADNIAVGTATVTVTAKTDGYFSGSANVIFEIKGSGEDGGEDSSSSGDSTVTAPKNRYTSTGNQIGQSILHSDLQRLVDGGKDLTVQSGTATMILAPAALRAILSAVPATAGDIAFAAAPADISAFPDAAALIGTRPVYSFTISHKDSNGNMMPVNVNFPAGSVSISLNYTPVESEVTGSLFMVYVDDKGAVTWLDKSSYNVNDAGGRVLADVPHFSVYGVAYKASVPVFTDITNHWAKADMEFVAARGLLFGTGEKVFSPDAAMTRGMFVTALGRLAGVNPDSYQTRSFQDVKADAYYAAYVEWAAQKGIVKGIGEGVFSPDAPVTREQMAVMMANYAGQMGYSIPAPLEEVTFADNDKIGAWAVKEVAAMQRAGIIKGKDGNRFDPQASATRAEVSAALRRLVHTVIDPAAATGWVKNDSGHWLYYQGGKVLTGWQTIGKLRYFFNADGVMHEGWKQDTSTGKWYFWTNAGVVIGWREIDRKWYYFDENGIMAVNTNVDGHEIGPDGARKEQ